MVVTSEALNEQHIHLVTHPVGLTSQKTHQGGLRLGGLVHEEAHPCFPYIIRTLFKRIDTGSTNCLLIQLIPSINYSVWKKKHTAVPCTPKFSKFPRMSFSSPIIIMII